MDWKEETCEFCMLRVGDLCRESPQFKKIVWHNQTISGEEHYEEACSKIQLELTSDKKEGNFCQCEEFKNKTVIGVGSGIKDNDSRYVERCDYIKNHKIYHDIFVCWKCLLPRRRL